MIRMKPLMGVCLSVFVPEMPDQAEVDSNDSVPEMIP